MCVGAAAAEWVGICLTVTSTSPHPPYHSDTHLFSHETRVTVNAEGNRWRQYGSAPTRFCRISDAGHIKQPEQTEMCVRLHQGRIFFMLDEMFSR